MAAVVISHDSETPAHGQQVITACAFIHHDFDGVTKLFLAKRAATKKFMPGIFELPGGHVAFGEDIVDGLKREIDEEFGMGVNIGDPFGVFTYMNKVKGSHSIEVVYFATFAEPIEHIHLNPEDHSEYGWYAETELDNILYIARHTDDPEAQTIKKGFSLLGSSGLNFG